ncbi:MAG TPA: BrnT family toxin [Pyrinomonadaceae bacterium]|nr:BrnT family toxin [Pyrinomonadaceae bacterium]
MFVWDESKRQQVIIDHNVDFELILDIFEDPFAIYNDDLGHSETKLRYTLVGMTVKYGLVFLVFTYVDEKIRFITARRAENWMVKEYER